MHNFLRFWVCIENEVAWFLVHEKQVIVGSAFMIGELGNSGEKAFNRRAHGEFREELRIWDESCRECIAHIKPVQKEDGLIFRRGRGQEIEIVQGKG